LYLFENETKREKSSEFVDLFSLGFIQQSDKTLALKTSATLIFLFLQTLFTFLKMNQGEKSPRSFSLCFESKNPKPFIKNSVPYVPLF
jgi:hypothetical protein